jgi:hypothetical protein
MKFIINNLSPDRLTDVECLEYVSRVMRKGKISNNDTQYCYIVTFDKVSLMSKTVPDEKIVVSSEKTKTGTFTFQVYFE